MSRVKKLLKFLSNPWLWMFVYFITSLTMAGWLIKKPAKVVIKTFILKTNANIEKGQDQRLPSFKKDKIFKNDGAIKKKV